MKDFELMTLCIEVSRQTRNGAVLDICTEVQKRLVGKTMAPEVKARRDRRKYQREYMREWRKRRANPFE